MSASLVGSEMCIRDRVRARANENNRPVPLFRSRRMTPLGPVWGGRESVSYTHLTLPTICSV
eukprot:8949747-Alexandrium_andersonii.AAC.1